MACLLKRPRSGAAGVVRRGRGCYPDTSMRHPFRDAPVVLLFCVGLAVAGWFLAMPLAIQTVHMAGFKELYAPLDVEDKARAVRQLDQILVLEPTGTLVHRARLAVSFGLVPVWAWVVIVFARVRARKSLARWKLFAAMAAVALACGLGMVLRVVYLNHVVGILRNADVGFPGLTLGNLSLAGSGVVAGLVAACVLVLMVLVSSSRRADGPAG